MDGTYQIRPKLTITVLLHSGALVNANLNPSKSFLGTILMENSHSASACSSLYPPSSRNTESGSLGGPDLCSVRKVVVPLVFDGQFFDILQSDIVSLSQIQQEEEAALSQDIYSLKAQLSRVVKPALFHKTDMEVWREIFRLYLDANIFFSNLEADHGFRSREQAAKAFQWWKELVEKEKLVSKFIVKESHIALERFINFNANVLMNLCFQELNQKAVVKILKSELMVLEWTENTREGGG